MDGNRREKKMFLGLPSDSPKSPRWSPIVTDFCRGVMNATTPTETCVGIQSRVGSGQKNKNTAPRHEKGGKETTGSGPVRRKRRSLRWRKGGGDVQ